MLAQTPRPNRNLGMPAVAFLAALALGALEAGSALAQTHWADGASNPVLTSRGMGLWDGFSVSAQSVVLRDDEFRVFYGGSSQEADFGLNNWQIGCATTADPSQPGWERCATNPGIRRGQVWDQNSRSPSVIFDTAENVYKMWYAGGRLADAYTMSIGYATSPDGEAWERRPEPVLVADSDWEGSFLDEPSVLYDGTTYRMWYSAVGPGFRAQIGFATSNDGIHWEKSSRNPVLGAGGEDLASLLLRPKVLYDEAASVYEMWYWNGFDIAYATSLDGETWARHPDGLVVVESDFFGPVLPGAVWREGDRYHLLYDADRGGFVYNSNYATAEWTVPRASFTAASETVEDRTQVRVDATRSTTPAAGTAAYLWDFGDGNQAEGVQAAHTYEHTGEYRIELTVTDSKGQRGRVARRIVVTSGDLPPDPIPVTPEVTSVSARVELTVGGLARLSRDFPLSEPVSLEGVSFVAADALVVSPETASSCNALTASLSLLSRGREVALVGSGGIIWCGTGGIVARLSTPLERTQVVVDAVRLTVFVGDEPSSRNRTVRARVAGFLPGGRMHVRFVRGEVLAEEGGDVAHRRRTISDVRPISVGGNNISAWQEFGFENPVPARGLSYVAHTAFGFNGSLGSMTESQLVLDDGSFLALDDAFSPSIGAADSQVISSGHSLLLDSRTRASLSGKEIVGWRWRAHRNGDPGGSITFSADFPVEILFFYDARARDCDGNGVDDGEDAATEDCDGNGLPDSCQPDCDGNGIADACDIERGRASDCNGNGIPDACDFESGLAADCNDNGSIDACDLVAATVSFEVADEPELGERVNPRAIEAADLDRDGDIDLIIPESSQDGVLLLRNQGNGTFSEPELLPTGDEPRAVAAADLSGDGVPDLAVVHFRDDNVIVLRGAGDGSFSPLDAVAAGDTPSWIAAMDADGDGDLDLAVGNDIGRGVSILVNDGAAGFTTGAALAFGSRRMVVPGDVDRDGDLDLVLGDPATREIIVRENDGTASFEHSETLVRLQGSFDVFDVADLDGNGFLDIVSANMQSGTVSVLLSDGAGAFDRGRARAYLSDAAPLPVTTMALGARDLNDDGRPDLLVATSRSAPSIFLGDSEGLFGEALPLPVAGTARDLAAADFNGDGVIDVAALGSGSVTVIAATLEPRSARDCNRNGVPDSCDIQSGVAEDLDANGIPDECELPGPQPLFRRGDANASGALEISDAIGSLGFLFAGGAHPGCLDALDVDDNGRIDVSDPVAGLNFLFLGGAAPPAPGPMSCGRDPTEDEIDCAEYPLEGCM